ncbi:farnesyl pyrophosphate synthase 1, mitochondrial-like [Trichoplusia ni]|uniref:Farnesyl pyrophosphate synthase 1, mitochondrial-like n=1 Tax=Trichoplusia ni TaxID=7111 RepID=A0A7E5WC98_TRINI|nr:farnesyl pyrophosphate synthase 1, mitochondrial-like [Trichoplusia ni]
MEFVCYLQMLEYVLTGGRLRRANDVTAAYVMFEKPENITEEKIHSSHILGWCAEMTYAYAYILDDLMDSSTTRRNKLCWHRQPNVGITAVNDATLLYQVILELLGIKFRHTPEYLDIVNVVNKVSTFSLVRRTFASTQKQYSLWHYEISLLLGLMLIKDGQKKVTKEWIDICFDIGLLFQIHNDYADLYEEESESGKVGYDIQEGKLTWLALTAVPRCKEQQLAAFKEFYGSPVPDHAKQIKQIYDDLKMPELYEKYESKLYYIVLGRIRALPTEPERKYFLNLLGESYKCGY